MIAYLDSSVVLRILLAERDELREWQELDRGVSSVLLRIECLRTLDRLWLEDRIDNATVETKRLETAAMLQRVDLRPIDEQVLQRAAMPLPVPVKTLDAIHLGTAMMYRARQSPDERPIVFATHDVALARAARAMHFDVTGAAP